MPQADIETGEKMESKILTVFLVIFILTGVAYLSYNRFEEEAAFKTGDLVFHTSLSSQSQAIQIATKSKYSHCGIVFEKEGVFYVYEAVQPVKVTPLDEWIARGDKGYYTLRRLKDAQIVLTPEAQGKLEAEAKKFLGKNYDLNFDWSDDKIYCSELIWKVYDRALGIQIGELQKLGEFDLNFPQAKALVKVRYGGINKFPFKEDVISPVGIFNSELLETIKDTYPDAK
jgi:hypothetical protein